MRRLVALLLLVAVPPARADWEVKRSPFDAHVVARYKQLLHRDPDDGDALGKLTQLYKQYRSVDQLRRELAATAQGGDGNDWLVLGRFLTARGDLKGAADAVQHALAARPTDTRAALALADLDQRLGQSTAARERYAATLPQLTDARQRRPVLRKLADLALAPDRGLPAEAALAEARPYYEELLRPGDAGDHDDGTRREWAEALAARNHAHEAAGLWSTLAQRLGRDPARQGQAWLRVGTLEEAGGDDKAARAAYDKTFALAPKGNYLRREAADKILGLARKHDELRLLVGEWERAWPESGRDFAEWETLGRVWDELGDADRAQVAFRRALALSPQALDSRKRLIALYERTGRDAEAIAEYRRLIQAAPGEARFRLELAERLMKTPDGRTEALKLAESLGRETSDPSVHAQLAELYSRWALPEQALHEQELLVRLEPEDESHLVALGELIWQKGNKARALKLWTKLLERGPHVPAMIRLAEVYVEHDLAPEALDLYQRAAKLAPDDANVQKGLASTLERLHRDREAEDVWATLFERAAGTKQGAALLELRQRLVTVLARQGRLGLRVAEYRTRAEQATDEPTAAAYTLFCADALLKMGRAEMAEELLQKLGDKAKSPKLRADAWIAIGQVERARHRPKQALAALKTAAELEPSRGRELYPQIAELSLQLYQDADALTYAKKAVELGPADAAAAIRLAEVLEKREDLAGAAAAYGRALEIDDRQWKVYFTLARLELRRGQEAHAAELYRAVLRRAPDEELVLDAARRAIDLEEYLGSLGDLERELSPLAYAHADRPVYRNLLLELYDRYGSPLVTRARQGDVSARPELARLGEHGLRPLLDVLVDGETTQQRVAVALLGAFGNASATPALAKLALMHKPREHEPTATRVDRAAAVELREQAALAAAELASPAQWPLLTKLLAEPEKQLRVAAVYGLGRSSDRRAQAALIGALDDGSVDVQAMACLSLGAHAGGHAYAALLERLRDRQRSPETRLGCAFAVGLLAQESPSPLTSAERAAGRAALVAVLREGADDLQRGAAWALGTLVDSRRRPGSDEPAETHAADAATALLSAALLDRDDVRRAALLALAGGRRLPPLAAPDFLQYGDDGADVKRTLARLSERVMTPADDDGVLPAPLAVAGALGSDEIAAIVVDGLGRHRDLVVRLIGDLQATAPELLAPLWPRVSPALRKAARPDDPLLRARVAQLAVHTGDAELTAAALADAALPVRLATLSALAAAPPLPSLTARAQLAPPLERALQAAEWRERRAAVQAVAAHGELWPDKGARALSALKRESNGFVREAVPAAIR